MPRACPAFGKICNYCKEKNHFIARCPKKRPSQQQNVHTIGTGYPQQQDDQDAELFIGEIKRSVHDCTVGKDNAWYTEAKVYNDTVKFKLDCGADANVLPLHVYAKMKQKKRLTETKTLLAAYGDFRIKPHGKCVMPCRIGTRTAELEFFVADVPSGPILGFHALNEMNLVQRVDTLVDPAGEKEKLLAEYRDVFTGLGCLEGTYHIEVDKSVPPVIHPPRKVPYGLQGKLKETLSNLEAQGVIARVEQPTDWVNSLVIVEKKDGSLRLCLDPRDLNKAIKREHYRIPTAEDISSTLAGKRVFSILDEKDGYWQVQLDEGSSLLCTFNTPFGRYRFRRMPFGIKSASEVFQRKNEAIFGDIPRVHNISDDIIIAAENEDEHDQIVRRVLKRARDRNVKFNPKKFKFRVQEVKYVGNIVSAQGLRPDDEKVQAIVKMPKPQCAADLHRLLGMINYLGQFIPNLSDVVAPLRSLLKKEVQWSWYPEHDLALEQVKSLLTTSPLLKFFDVNKSITLQVDASQHGLGACLFQDDHPVAHASRALSEAECNYAQIEKELLAIVFACEKFYQYIYGQKVEVQSDHKPLEAIFDKPLSKVAPRLQRMRLRLQKYQLNVTYHPGKYMYVTDTLSRAYLDEPAATEEDSDVVVHSVVQDLPVSPEKRKQLQEATSQDDALQTLIKLQKDGWPLHKHHTPFEVRHYWNLRQDIFEADGLLVLGDKLIIPSSMRTEMLTKIHQGHFGMEKC